VGGWRRSPVVLAPRKRHSTHFIGGWVGPRDPLPPPPQTGFDAWTMQVMPTELLRLSCSIDMVAKIQTIVYIRRFPLLKASILPLGTNQPTLQWIPTAYYSGLKQQEHEALHSTACSAEAKNAPCLYGVNRPRYGCSSMCWSLCGQAVCLCVQHSQAVFLTAVQARIKGRAFRATVSGPKL
jgi:hypothetical protein